MAENRDPQRDVARYLQLQGRAPQSHLDWDMWRKVGQPGTYQAPPGGPTQFRGTSAGVGAPNYDRGDTHYNMFSDLNKTIEDTVRGVGMWAANRLKRSDDDDGNGKIAGSSSSSGSSSTMADGTDGMGGATGGGRADRSQNASVTAPAASRGMRRSRRGDFGGTLSSMGITMVQGNDNYGQVFGNMGGANVGSGDYDNSFQSKNTGGRQTAFSGNNFGGTTPGGGFPPPTPTPPPPPPTTPGGTPPPPPGGGTPPGGGGGTPPPPTPPGTPPGGFIASDPRTVKNPPLTPVGGPPQIGPGPQRPQLPVGQGPSTYGNTEGVQGAQDTKELERLDKVTSLATGGSTEGERDAAGATLNRSGIQSNTNPANQRGANDTAPPMLAGYENMQEPAPQQNTRFGDMGMGIPANAPTGGGLPPQYDRMRPALPAQYQTPTRNYDRPAQGGGLPAQYSSMTGPMRSNPEAYNTTPGRSYTPPPSDGNWSGRTLNPAPTQNQVAWPEGSQAAGNNPPAPAPAKKAAARKSPAKKAAAPKATEGPKSVASKKAGPKLKTDAKDTPKKRGTK